MNTEQPPDKKKIEQNDKAPQQHSESEQTTQQTDLEKHSHSDAPASVSQPLNKPPEKAFSATTEPQAKPDLHPESSDDSSLVEGYYRNASHEIFYNIVTAFFVVILGFTAWGGSMVDIYTRLLPDTESHEDIVTVSIGPEALRLWHGPNQKTDVTSRELLAHLVSFLDQAGASTIMIDIRMDSPQPGDEKLAQAMNQHGHVLGAAIALQNSPRDTNKLFVAGAPNELNGSFYHGYSNVYQEGAIFFSNNLVSRGVYPFKNVRYLASDTAWPDSTVTLEQDIFSLSLATAIVHKERKKDPDFKLSSLEEMIPTESNCSEQLSQSFGTSICLDRPIWLQLTNEEGRSEIVNIDAAEILMATGIHEQKRRLFVENNLQPEPLTIPQNLNKFKDKIVIIGRVDQINDDANRHTTAFSFPFFSKKDMSGLTLQAQYVESFLQQRFVTFLPKGIEFGLTILMIFLSVKIYRQTAAKYHLQLVSLSFFGLFLLGYAMFRFADFTVLELGYPLTGSIITFILLYTVDLQKNT